jgi:hypothetical protein
MATHRQPRTGSMGLYPRSQGPVIPGWTDRPPRRPPPSYPDATMSSSRALTASFTRAGFRLWPGLVWPGPAWSGATELEVLINDAPWERTASLSADLPPKMAALSGDQRAAILGGDFVLTCRPVMRSGGRGPAASTSVGLRG